MAVIGIDTGGTFCDLVCLDDAGRAIVRKAPSTPSHPAQGVFDVLDTLNEDAAAPTGIFPDIRAIAIGTTIATNAVVTHSGSKVGLLTTRGYGDMLTIMRVQGRVAGRPLQEMQSYAVTKKPAAIVPKTLIAEIDERIDFTGDVIVTLDEGQVARELDRLVDAGIEALAVSFLWSFLNPDHERRVKDIVEARHPGLFVSLGSALASRLGEYERTEAAVLNAYVARPVRRYLETISTGLQAKGTAAPLLVMHSAGGGSRPTPIRRASRSQRSSRVRLAASWRPCGCLTPSASRTWSARMWAERPSMSASSSTGGRCCAAPRSSTSG